jgi:hypothetical protein
MVIRFLEREVTDLRDKIYALLGLCKEGDSLEDYPLLKPNYKNLVARVYWDAIRNSLWNSRSICLDSLVILSFAQLSDHDADEDFPSWIPP